MNDSTPISPSSISNIYSPRDEIACYSLPYGTLGFVSDLLTLYTAWRLSLGKKPLWAGVLSDSRASFALNICLGIATFTGAYVSALITVYRCRGSWQVELVAAYKLVVTLTVILIGMHHTVMAQIRRKRRERRKVSAIRGYGRRYNGHRDGVLVWGRTLYSAGAIVGAIGLLTLAYAVTESEEEEDMTSAKYLRGISAGFALAVVLTTAGVIIQRRVYDWRRHEEGMCTRTMYCFLSFIFHSVFVFSLFFALYCDWALAAITGDWIGSPSHSQSAVYWVYFAAKRLPLLMQ